MTPEIMILQNIGGALLSFLGTRVGNILVALIVGGWFWGSHVESAWKDREAAAQAAADAKAAEWEAAAKEIAQAATDREEEHNAQAARQSAFTSSHIERESSNAKAGGRSGLFLDSDFAGLVLALDAAGKPNAPGAAAKFRQARSIARSDNCAAVKIFALRNREAATEANRRLLADWAFYADVMRRFSEAEQ